MNHSLGSATISRYDRDVAFTVALQASLMMAKNMLVSVSNGLLAINGILNLVLFVIIGCFYIRFFLRHKIRIVKSVVALLSAVAVFVLITFIIRPNLFSYPLVIQAMYLFAVNAVPVLLLFPRMNSVDALLEAFYKASFILAFIDVLCVPLFFVNKNVGAIEDYSMSYGQAAMVQCVFLYSKFFRDRDLKALALAVVANFCVFIVGSRFPLLCIGVFVVIKLLQRLKNSRYRFLLVLVPLVFLLIYFGQGYILEALYKLLVSVGVQSRSLAYLTNGRLLYDSGRYVIHQVVYEALKKSPILGYGFGGGYIIVNGMTHSLVLDILCNLGIPAGLVFIAWFCIQYISKIRNNKNDKAYVELMLLFGCLFLPKAFFGGELWETDKFWWVIALIIMANHRLRRSRDTYEDPLRDRTLERTSYHSV